MVAIAGGMVLGYVLGRLDERKTLLLDELPAVWTVALVAITSFLSVAVRSATGSYRTILFGACGGFFLTMYVFVLKAIRAGRLPPPRPEPHEYAGARPQAITPGRLAIVAGVLVFGVLVGTAAGTVSAGVGGVIIAAAAVAVATSLFWLWRRFFGGRRVV